MDTEFLFCCGIEDTFIADPYPKTGKVLDEYDLTGHYQHWKDDFDRVKGLGCDALRWGIPWYRVQPQKDTWDWSWTDQTIPYLVEEKGITVILDLMHYGTPLWMKKSYQDPDYPSFVETYTAKVIERYQKYLKFVVPYNEPHTAAEFAGRQGVWPPYSQGFDGYLSVMKAVVLGAQRQTNLIQRKGLQTVQVECSGGSFALDEATKDLAQWETTAQSMYFDLLTGHVERLLPYASFFGAHGWNEHVLAEFQTHAAEIGIMGVNFYPQFSFQDIWMGKDGTVKRKNHPVWIPDLERLLRKRYNAYACPMIITETSVRDDLTMKRFWLKESMEKTVSLFRSGFPILGYTWFPIIDMVDWSYRTQDGEKENFMARFGFWDEQRKENSCAELYRELVRNYHGDN